MVHRSEGHLATFWRWHTREREARRESEFERRVENDRIEAVILKRDVLEIGDMNGTNVVEPRVLRLDGQ